MIELTARRATSTSSRSIKIIGIGGAGANALDRMALDGVNPCHLVAANTDAKALTASVAGEKIQLGRIATRGLGSGGDPDLGSEAAAESVGELRASLEGVDCVFVLAGLGGGTGSGAVPIVAELAREAGALVIAVVTLPFVFEGKRRARQAADSLALLHQHSDAVVCFENDRMADAVSPNAPIQQAFAAADQTISQSVQAIAGLLSLDGLIRLGFDDFRAALNPAMGAGSRCLFGFGEAEGDNRPYDALARALKNPLMDKGRLFRECDSVLVQVSGGADLTLNEVQLLMEEFNRNVGEETRILFGAAIDPQLSGRIAVTIICALGSEEASRSGSTPQASARTLPFPIPAAAPAAPPRVASPKVSSAPIAPMVPEAPVFAAELPHEFEELEVKAKATEPSESFDDELEAGSDDIEETELPAHIFVSDEEDDVLTALEPDTEGLEVAAQFEPEPAVPAAPVITPQKRRVFGGATQSSLFGEPQRSPEQAAELDSEDQSAPTPAPERAARPLPGRTLQPAASRTLFRKGLPPDAKSAPAVDTVTNPVPPEPVEELAPEPLPVSVAAPLPPPPALASSPVVRRPVAAQIPAPAPASVGAGAAPATPAVPASPKTPQQETLQFEPLTRGRFEKSEPTIVDGQDLDVPTFLRRNVRIR